MNIQSALLNRWDHVRGSYWFVPSLMMAGAVVLSGLSLYLDGMLPQDAFGNVWWVYTGSASGARAVLQTIATSMIGLAGVVFSLTTVTLTLAANKFGPRIFRNFMRDLGNQVVLGTFVSTFLYCLLVLRQVRGVDGDRDGFIPQISMLLAVVMAICGLGVLIYFIHHIASSIQTGNVIAAIGRDFLDEIHNLYPEQIGSEPEESKDNDGLMAQFPGRFDDESAPVRAGSGGYLRRIEPNVLLRLAREHDLIVRLERSPGDFVASEDTVLRIHPPQNANDEVVEKLQQSFVIGDQRTPVQDIRFPLGQLLEIAALALSSGVNDLYTTIMCVDRMGEGLAFLASRNVPSAFRADDAGRLRVVARSPGLPELVADAFGLVRRNGAHQPKVMAAVLDSLVRIAGQAKGQKDRAAILEQAEAVREQVANAGVAKLDQAAVEAKFELVLRSLAAAADPDQKSKVIKGA